MRTQGGVVAQAAGPEAHRVRLLQRIRSNEIGHRGDATRLAAGDRATNHGADGLLRRPIAPVGNRMRPRSRRTPHTHEGRRI